MNFGVNCIISRKVVLFKVFPGLLLVASLKRPLLEGKMSLLWVSERKRMIEMIVYGVQLF